MKGRNLSAARRPGLAAAVGVLVAAAGAGIPAAAASTGGAGHRCLPQTAYVLTSNSGIVTPISTRTNTAGRAIYGGQYPEAIAITPDGKTAYVVDAVPGTVTPISTRTGTHGPAIRVGKYPSVIAITPEG